GILSAELWRPTLPAWRRAATRAAIDVRLAGESAETEGIVKGTVAAATPTVLLIDDSQLLTAAGAGEQITALWSSHPLLITLAPVMAAGFRVVALDLLGFGSSDKPAHGYTNAAYAHLVVALMDSLHLPDAVLVGHSMGGEIAAEVAIAFPTRVRGLVLMAAAGLGTREPLLFRVGRWPVVGPLMLAFRGRALAARLLRSTYADP